MKKLLLAVLLGVGTFLPTTEVMSKVVAQARIINIFIEGYQLIAHSDAASGLILQMQIYSVSTGTIVRTQGCDSYDCSVSLEGLPSGAYVGYVICQNGTASKKFYR
jgi:hypothetical protein